MNDHVTMSPAGAPVPPAGGNRPEPADDFEVLLITGMSPMPPTAWRTWDGTSSTICRRNYWSRWST